MQDFLSKHGKELGEKMQVAQELKGKRYTPPIVPKNSLAVKSKHMISIKRNSEVKLKNSCFEKESLEKKIKNLIFVRRKLEEIHSSVPGKENLEVREKNAIPEEGKTEHKKLSHNWEEG